MTDTEMTFDELNAAIADATDGLNDLLKVKRDRRLTELHRMHRANEDLTVAEKQTLTDHILRNKHILNK